MEREIIIANTKTQKRSKINSNAMTLGELKTELNAAGIDYSNMTFTEGISKTQLLSDETQLPQNVMYKGNPTNNLVILLTNTKKKIASGADRKEAYALIKEYNLQDAVKEEYGKNYTQVSTDKLFEIINSDKSFVLKASDKEEEVKEIPSIVEDIEDEEYINKYTLEDYLSNVRIITISDSISYHIAMLAKDEALNVSDIMHIKEDLDFFIKALQVNGKNTIPSNPVSTSDGSIKDDDVDDIMNSLEM